MAKRKDGRTPPAAHSHAPEYGVHAFELLRPADSGVHALLATAVPGRGLVPLPRGGYAPAGVGRAPQVQFGGWAQVVCVCVFVCAYVCVCGRHCKTEVMDEMG
jgi:hypothetical protein